MNKLAIVCLLGVASARKCPFLQKIDDQSEKMIGFPISKYFAKDRSMCPNYGQKRLRWEKYTIKLASATYREGVRGLYQERSQVISDQCFGDWINDDYIPAGKIMKKYREDPSSISLTEAKAFFENILEIIFKNAEICQF